MKKIIFVLTLLLLVSPALAKMEISCDSDGLVVSVYYDRSAGDTNLPRAFGLDIKLSNDANIVSVDNLHPVFWVHPGSIDINTTAVPPVVDSNGTAVLSPIDYPQAGGLPGPPDGNGMTIEMGSLYLMADGNQTPEPNGLLLTFTVDADCNVAISGNTALGKVVLENTKEDNTDYGSGCVVAGGYTCCPGDFDEDSNVDIDDYMEMKNRLFEAWIISGATSGGEFLIIDGNSLTGYLYPACP